MSVMRHDQTQVSLPRAGLDPFWKEVDRRYASPTAVDETTDHAVGKRRRQTLSEHRWRALAMLALRENAGWSLERIGRAFGRDRGHVSRCLKQVIAELRETLGHEPTMNVNSQPVPSRDDLRFDDWELDSPEREDDVLPEQEGTAC